MNCREVRIEVPKQRVGRVEVCQMDVVPRLSQSVGDADDLPFRTPNRQTIEKQQRCGHG